MATAPVRNNTQRLANRYGAGPHYLLDETILGAGAAAPTVPAIGAAVPPCAIEIVSITRTSAGVYTLTFADNYYAIASWSVCIDDVNGATPCAGYLGQFANLGTGTPMTCVLTTYNSAFAATDMALGTPIRLSIAFKKDSSGAAA
jgi:hypothetical protein